MMSKLHSVKSKASKYIVTLFVVMSMAAMTCLTCFATGEESSAVNISETIRTSFSTMQNDLISYIGIVLPIGLTIFGTYWGIQKAIKFFKKSSN